MKFTLITALATCLLVACAAYKPPPGLMGRAEADVLQAMGQPTNRYTLPNSGRRLEYAKGPSGRDTYMVDLDSQGRVVQVEQVLEPRYFDAVNPGLKSDELLRFIGRPCERVGVRGGGQIWSWRFQNTDCLWWQAQLDAQGVVTNTGYTSAPGCDPGA